jgi:hypothetical protein
MNNLNRIALKLEAAATELKAKLNRSVDNEPVGNKPKGSHYEVTVQYQNKSSGEDGGIRFYLPESSTLADISKRLQTASKTLSPLVLASDMASVHITRKS